MVHKNSDTLLELTTETMVLRWNIARDGRCLLTLVDVGGHVQRRVAGGRGGGCGVVVLGRVAAEVAGNAVRYELADLLDEVADAGHVLGRRVRVAVGQADGRPAEREQRASHAGLEATDGRVRSRVALDHLGPGQLVVSGGGPVGGGGGGHGDHRGQRCHVLDEHGVCARRQDGGML